MNVIIEYANSKCFWRNLLCFRSNLRNEDITSALRPGLKTVKDFRGLV